MLCRNDRRVWLRKERRLIGGSASSAVRDRLRQKACVNVGVDSQNREAQSVQNKRWNGNGEERLLYNRYHIVDRG